MPILSREQIEGNCGHKVEGWMAAVNRIEFIDRLRETALSLYDEVDRLKRRYASKVNDMTYDMKQFEEKIARLREELSSTDRYAKDQYAAYEKTIAALREENSKLCFAHHTICNDMLKLKAALHDREGMVKVLMGEDAMTRSKLAAANEVVAAAKEHQKKHLCQNCDALNAALKRLEEGKE